MLLSPKAISFSVFCSLAALCGTESPMGKQLSAKQMIVTVGLYALNLVTMFG
jgi:hypothetical protein